jgi:hypothetical protein
VSAYNFLTNDETVSNRDPSINLIKDRIYNLIDPVHIQQFKLRKPDCPFKPTYNDNSCLNNNKLVEKLHTIKIKNHLDLPTFQLLLK